LRDLTAWQQVSIQKRGKKEQNPNLLKQHRTLTLIVRLWRAEGARFLCVYCGGYFLRDRLHAFVGGCGTRFAARKSSDGDLLASSRGAEKVKAVVLQQGEGKNNIMIYDVNSALFRSFLSQKGAGDKRKMEEQKPSSQKPKANENKPVMNE
jgi:hypothetical protein